MTLSQYCYLKEQVIKIFGENERHGALLSKFKELYRSKINSPRRFEQISTIGQLLRILEVRDILSETKILPLKEISAELNNNQLFKKIQEYEQFGVPTDFSNYYNSVNTQQSQQRQAAESFVSPNPHSGMSERKIQRIKQRVIEDIGIFWRDLARCLGLKESKIQEVNEQYKDVPKKAEHVLEYYLENIADPHTWFFDLCEAIELSRRKDLAKKIKKISVMNI